MLRSSRPEVILGKGVLKIYRKFTGEQPYQSVVPIKLLCNFIEIALHHGCSPVGLLRTFRTPFPKNTSGWLFLNAENPRKSLGRMFKLRDILDQRTEKL